ncbi:MAG: hypothetical protein HPY55_09040 [Firmicutes bacterium]|nr:hypothetical protein [Bacillota bacterium]
MFEHAGLIVTLHPLLAGVAAVAWFTVLSLAIRDMTLGRLRRKAAAARAATSWCAPALAERLSRRARNRMMVKSLPEAIDLLLVCANAGMNLSNALKYVGGVVRGPLGEAIRRVSALEASGVSLVGALREVFGEGTPAPVRMFSSIVGHAHARGSPVSEVLKAQAWATRVHRKNELEGVIRTLPTRVSVCAIVFLLPSMLVLTLLPAVLMFITSRW